MHVRVVGCPVYRVNCNDNWSSCVRQTSPRRIVGEDPLHTVRQCQHAWNREPAHWQCLSHLVQLASLRKCFGYLAKPPCSRLVYHCSAVANHYHALAVEHYKSECFCDQPDQLLRAFTMPQLIDLDLDILCKILALVRASSDSQNVRILWPISLTCKILNTVCGHWIFHTYHLSIRNPYWLGPGRPHRDPITGETMLRWNSGAVLQRLDHFRLKAPFIRTLTIADALSGGDEQGFLPKEIIPALIDGLECAGNLKSLSFIGPKARSPAVRLPYAVWLWISRHDFQSLSFYENIGPPECATPSTGRVEKFTVSLYKDGSARFLDVSAMHPSSICIAHRVRSLSFSLFTPTSFTLDIHAQMRLSFTLRLRFSSPDPPMRICA